MLRKLSKNWWVLAVRGLLAIIFGVLAFALPRLTLVALVWMFGVYALADGLFQIISGLTNRRKYDGWGWILLEGFFGVIFGVLVLIWPTITAIVLLLFIAAWAVITGVLEIISAIVLRKEIKNEWLLALSGVLSVLLGVLMFVWPGATALAMVWLIGIYAVIFGVTLIALGFRLKNSFEEMPAVE